MHPDASCEGVEKSADSASPEPEGAAPTDFREEREELERVLNSPEISRSTSLVRFLSFICNKYFEGQAEDIREYTIAVAALGRKESSFDSHIDPIVRVTARSLRKKLWNLYQTEGQNHPLQIVLPLGHYVPQFVRPNAPGAQHSMPPEEPAIDSVDAEGAAADEDAAANENAPAPNSPRLASAAFFGMHRRTYLQLALVLFVVPAIFLAGYFFGRRTGRNVPPATQSFAWGDPAWSDEFDGGAGQLPDPSKWAYDTGNTVWGNNELETYCSPRGANPRGCDPHRPNAFQDGAGHLALRAQRNPDGSWTSARITTRGLKDFQYGRIEARMKLPVGTGLWPSFWMLGANFPTVGWPASGSVTIAENISLTPRSNGLGPTMIRSTLHGPRYYGGNGLWHDFKLPNGARVDDGGFHTYGIIWSPGMMQFYVDDPANIYFVQDANDLPEGGEWVFDHPFYLIVNLAIGGDWPGSPDATTPNPAEILVDYVRVYKIPSVPAPTIQWQPVPVKAGSSVASMVTLHAENYSGRVHLACSTEPATAACGLAASVVDFSGTLSQEDSLTISTDFFTDKGRVVAPPGRYKMTITATTISGDRSQLTVPFEVRNSE
ncbi:MAG: glycoside hydrolase family 16 protein [Terracidiphilus sp.]